MNFTPFLTWLVNFVPWTMQYLYNLHEVAEKNNDGQFADFVEVMLEEQVWHSDTFGLGALNFPSSKVFCVC